MRRLFTLFIIFLSAQAFSADYFWVGGSGNWSDISHWAAVSGGTIKYPVAPSSEDNVIFDENSFTAANQVVSFQNEIIFCKSMDWSSVTNSPRLAGAEGVTISIFGDLTFHSDMVLTFEGKFLLTGIAENKRIDLADLVIPGVITLEGESTWDMDSGINIDSMLEIRRGNLNLNGLPISCGYLHINTNGQKNINIENSNILISGVYQDEFGYDGDGSVSFYMQNFGLELEAEGSVIEISAPNATFYHYGPQDDIQLGVVNFSSPLGSVYMTSRYFDESLLFRDLIFNSSAVVEGTVYAESISFGAGGRYRFGSDREYVFGSISAAGDCVEGVIITSDNPGFASIFTVSGGVDLEYLTLRDIHGSGSAVLNANNGVDLGNNDGWNFTNAMAVDFYWIGGTGMWDDPLHWSFSSGGPSSGCVPTGKDDAFFDANSFTGPNQSVSLNNRSTFIHNMVWNGVGGNPEFTGEEIQRIVVTGSIELDPNMEHDVEGIYNFESAEMGKTIRMNGNIFNQSITFSGLLAEWTFLDDVEVYRQVYFGSGILRTGGNQFTTTRFRANSRLERTLDISDSYVLLRESVYQNPEWSANLENYTVIADNSTIEFTANGNFDHDGRGYGVIPTYNIVQFNNLNGGVRSINQETDESEPAILINDLSFAGRGGFGGSSHIRTLRLADGFSYYFDSGYNRKQVIDDIITQGTCENGLTQLFGSDPGNQANIEFPVTFTLERMYIQDIAILAGTLVNNNSLDGGNNVNMTFNELIGRTLFWVGNAGEWQDPSHWSLSSGGPGGECIPTAIDDVFFDNNSFNLDVQLVTAIPSTFAYCHDINITGVTGYPQMQLNFLLVNGSLEYDVDFLNNINEHIFIGSEIATINTGGQQLNNVRFRGGGTFDFINDFLFNRWYHNAGIINFNDYLVHGASMDFYGGAEKILNLEESRIILEDGGQTFNDRSDFLIVNPGISEITFTANVAGVFSLNQIAFNKVNFTNTQGVGFFASRRTDDEDDYIGTMRASNVQFSGNGTIFGHLISDTLVGVAGKVYTFDSDRIVEVTSYLQLRGNNCTSIELRSSDNAVKATVEMPSTSEVVVDFVQMNNIIGVGGADFNAGSRSVDVGNSNVGWTFEDPPDFIESGFLGEDLAICNGAPVELTAFSYSVNEQYLWSDGSMDSVLSVGSPGLYFVEVQFESNCVIVDSIEILDGQLYDAELPDSTVICALATAELDATVQDGDVSYLWSTGSTTSVIDVIDEGKYIVQVEALGCVSTDSTIVSFVADPGDFLPRDSSLCNGDDYMLSSLLEGQEYEWQNGLQSEEILVESGGVYWLDAAFDGCIFRDTFLVEELFGPEIDLGRDTSICSNSELNIDLNPGTTYEWNDGTSSSNYQINSEGNYIVQAFGSNGCESSDSIFVSILPVPSLDLGDDIESCGSMEIILTAPSGLSNFEWEDGTTSEQRTINDEGEYFITTEENGCIGLDSIYVSFLELPEIDLGPADTLACNDEPLRITPVNISAGDLTWQNSSAEDFFEATAPGFVVASVFNGECYNTDSIQVAFKDCTFFDIYVPNVFSPNEDGYNDQFEIFFPEDLLIESFTINIFDRWGNRVFTSKELADHWDGTLGEDNLQAGVYVYAISLAYIDENGQGSEEIRGDIAIIR